MKGLLYKDFCILMRQMRIFMFAILLLCVVNEQLVTFAILYAAMLPYSTLAYDEQSQWLRFAAMTPCRPLDIVLSKYLPYSTLAYDEQSQWLRFAAMTPCRPLDIVLSKYLLGWLLMGCTAAISLLLNAMIGRLGTELSAAAVISALAAGLICLAVMLPVMFRFGVERARMGVILIFVVIFSLVGSGEFFTASALPVLENLPLLLMAAAVLISAGSVMLSVKLFRGRE